MTGPGRDPARPGRPAWRHAAGILAASFSLVAAAVVWRLGPVLASRGQRAVGDTRTVASYGFDLSTCLVPREEIVAGGMPRDGVPVLEMPRLLTAAGADSLRRAARYRYLVPSDRVVGVTLGGVDRAYPLRVLCWHEAVLDTLAGRPIAVTYNALSDAAAAFGRDLPETATASGTTAGSALFAADSAADSAAACAAANAVASAAAVAAANATASGPAGAAPLRFGVSGLLLDSHMLLYDRGAAVPSLWSPLQGRAVAGPAAAAGRALPLLPLAVVRWDDWRARHPATTVLFPEPAFRDRYRREPYSTYFGDDRLRFPARPLPPASALARKDLVAVVTAGGETVAYPLRAIARRAAGEETADETGEETGEGAPAPVGAPQPVLGPVGTAGSWITAQGGVRLRFDYRPDPPAVFVTLADAGAPEARGAGVDEAKPGSPAAAAPFSVRTCFWFAWYAQETGSAVRWP